MGTCYLLLNRMCVTGYKEKVGKYALYVCMRGYNIIMEMYSLRGFRDSTLRMMKIGSGVGR